MEFEAGPWTCFGTELLDQLDELVNGDPLDGDQRSLDGLCFLIFLQYDKNWSVTLSTLDRL